VKETGVEIGAGLILSRNWRVDGHFTAFSADVDSTTLIPGDRLLPNTPGRKGGIAVSYSGATRLDARAAARWVQQYEYYYGVFAGTVPASASVDLTASYRLRDNVRTELAVTNLLDQRRYEIFGGSVIGRRALLGVTFGF
jgi:outer membrane receptor protein involved in Fe transport